jgi:excisionase family DNA binding protein
LIRWISQREVSPSSRQRQRLNRALDAPTDEGAVEVSTSSEDVFEGRDPEEWMTPSQAKDELVCGVDYVWRLCREGKLKHRRKGRQILIKRAHAREFADAQVRGGE